MTPHCNQLNISILVAKNQKTQQLFVISDYMACGKEHVSLRGLDPLGIALFVLIVALGPISPRKFSRNISASQAPFQRCSKCGAYSRGFGLFRFWSFKAHPKPPPTVPVHHEQYWSPPRWVAIMLSAEKEGSNQIQCFSKNVGSVDECDHTRISNVKHFGSLQRPIGNGYQVRTIDLDEFRKRASRFCARRWQKTCDVPQRTPPDVRVAKTWKYRK